jgi:hypothetical protein
MEGCCPSVFSDEMTETVSKRAEKTRWGGNRDLLLTIQVNARDAGNHPPVGELATSFSWLLFSTTISPSIRTLRIQDA